MKKLIRIASAVALSAIAVAAPCAPFRVAANAATAAFDNIMIQSGRDTTELNFNYVTYERPDATIVQIAPASYYSGTFPVAVSMSFKGTAEKTPISMQINGKNAFVYDNEVVATGLSPSTEYVYRVGNGYDWSECYTYKTPALDSYRIFAFSDIHMYDLYHPSIEAGQNWQRNLTRITRTWPEISHALALGDQMQDSDRLDYNEYLLKPKELRNISFAPINGNHDVNPAGTYFQKYFYNAPNIAKEGDDAYTGRNIEDYYYLYGDTLFVMLNYEYNAVKWKDNLGHWEKTLIKATEEYAGKYEWLIACFHEDVYGEGFTTDIADRDGITDYNNENSLEGEYHRYQSMIDALDRYKVDLVLDGHAHTYTRSYFMQGGKIVQNTRDASGAYVDPVGIPYIGCSTTSTLGGDENELYPRNEYTAHPWLDNSLSQSWRSTYLVLESNENYLTVTAYEVKDPLHVFDTITLKKSNSGYVPPTADGLSANFAGISADGERTDGAKTAAIATTGAVGMSAVALTVGLAVKKRKERRGNR